jgi:pilus retraction protein PilT
MDITALLQGMEDREASDLFLCVGKVPSYRVAGRIVAAGDAVLAAGDVDAFLAAHLPADVMARLERERDLDLGVSLEERDRYRLNLSYQRGRLAVAARRVPSGALAFEELLLPPALRTLAEAPRGLVLVTGATGSGKSTTMAAMVHHINSTMGKHVVTIEDPIEFIHEDRLSVVSQREVGADTRGFGEALRHAVRQNPDVILVGEMRDMETVRTALSAALTGHLVLSTLHTADVAQTLERIVNWFPAEARDQIALDLSMALVGIVSQRLVPHADGKGRVPAVEVLVVGPYARKVIAKRRLEEIGDIIKEGAAEGMMTFHRALIALCRQGLIGVEQAAAHATNRDEFLLGMQGMETGIESIRRGGTTGGTESGGALDMRRLLHSTARAGASDLILTAGSRPRIRVAGELRSFDMPELTPADTRKLLFSILSASQRALFEEEKEIDFALSVSDRFGDDESPQDADTLENRFRVNGFYQRGAVGCVMRLVPRGIPDPGKLMIPPAIMRLARLKQGLVLVTGPTGHGKSTTLACLVDEINRSRACHIVTVEDPIEYIHANQKSVIEQREVHADTKSFPMALRHVLRQDPDVILIGEMRDLETVSAALTAAETGHLVFSTLHTNDCTQTVDRIIDMFPGDAQNQVRVQLAACLEAVVSQRLLPKKGFPDQRVAAFEIMIGSAGVRAQIRESRTHQLLGTIQTGAREGMITMDRALDDLRDAGWIDSETRQSMARAADRRDPP